MERSIDKHVEKLVMIIALIALFSFLLSFFYLPLIKILSFAFQKGDSSDATVFSVFWSTITQSSNMRFLAFSFNQAFISTIICLSFGIPVSYFFAKYKFRGKDLVLNLLTVPFVLPPIVVLLGFVITYGENGWLNIIWKAIFQTDRSLFNIFGTVEGIIAAHVFYNLSVIIRLMIPAWMNLDYEQVEVSKTLGVKNLTIFRKIVFPQLINFIVSAALLVFIYCFNSFAIVLYLGEVKYQTLEVRIYKLIKNSLKFTEGSSLALIQILINTLIIIIYLFFENRTRQMARGKEKGIKPKPIKLRNTPLMEKLSFLFLSMITLFVMFFSFSPMIAVIIESFIPFTKGISPLWGYITLLSSEYMAILGNSPFRMLINTILFSFSATVITLFFSLLIVLILRIKYNKIRNYKHSIVENFISYVIILPMATSSITLALGLFLKYRTTEVYLNYVWVLIILSHVLISIPFATRSILAAYNRIDVEMLNVASTLGASRLFIFKKIEFPLIVKSLIVGGIFSFAISLGEFGATNFLVRGNFGTLSIAIYKLIISQTIQLPATMASILIILTVISFLVIQKLGDIELKV
ncbi:MAG: iron ABC transporter permease [Candidatus Heimdallarchaeum endolithica]|uniref:Iron ABC transporter permease n=1 Tax=Candidatus Heimdallarchaeum endolithica TaxID=2876572 RepID=A0A9Y1BSB9_9ARCH|nr:MAG: iron ABC transporter permease [Candidatus Heimdallarchaeum endolithica]